MVIPRGFRFLYVFFLFSCCLGARVIVVVLVRRVVVSSQYDDLVFVSVY